MEYQIALWDVQGSGYSLVDFLLGKVKKLKQNLDDLLAGIGNALRAFTLPWPNYVALTGDPASNEKCGGFKEDWQQRILCIYKWIADASQLYPVIDKAIKLRRTGKTEKESYYAQIGHKLNHLGNLLASIVYQVHQTGLTWDSFISKENVACLVDAFTCLNLDIGRLLELAGVKDGKCTNDICCPDVVPINVLQLCQDVYPSFTEEDVVIPFTNEALEYTQSNVVTLDCCNGEDTIEFIKYETNYPTALNFVFTDGLVVSTKTLAYTFAGDNPEHNIAFHVRTYYRFCGLYCLVKQVNYTMKCDIGSSDIILTPAMLSFNNSTNDVISGADTLPVEIASTSKDFDLSCCYYTDTEVAFTGYTGEVAELAAKGIILGVPTTVDGTATIKFLATRILDANTDNTIIAHFTTCLGKKTFSCSINVNITLV